MPEESAHADLKPGVPPRQVSTDTDADQPEPEHAFPDYPDEMSSDPTQDEPEEETEEEDEPGISAGGHAAIGVGLAGIAGVIGLFSWLGPVGSLWAAGGAVGLGGVFMLRRHLTGGAGRSALRGLGGKGHWGAVGRALGRTRAGALMRAAGARLGRSKLGRAMQRAAARRTARAEKRTARKASQNASGSPNSRSGGKGRRGIVGAMTGKSGGKKGHSAGAGRGAKGSGGKSGGKASGGKSSGGKSSGGKSGGKSWWSGGSGSPDKKKPKTQRNGPGHPHNTAPDRAAEPPTPKPVSPPEPTSPTTPNSTTSTAPPDRRDSHVSTSTRSEPMTYVDDLVDSSARMGDCAQRAQHLTHVQGIQAEFIQVLENLILGFAQVGHSLNHQPHLKDGSGDFLAAISAALAPVHQVATEWQAALRAVHRDDLERIESGNGFLDAQVPEAS